MDKQKTEKVGYSKALIALIATLSCLVIYILACVASPPGWSPDSSKIAILVTPPGDDPDIAIFTYDITTGERVLLDKVEKDGLLSAPAWSPDGKWIAYYRVDPSPPEESLSDPNTDPNIPISTKESAGGDATKSLINKMQKQTKAAVIGEEFFSEENKILHPLLCNTFTQALCDDISKTELFDVKLIIVKPDGTESKVLRVMQSECDEDRRKLFLLMQPQWSPDCKYLFYERLLGSKELFYIGSLNITTGETYAHLFSSIGIPAVSPDGKWVASLFGESDRTTVSIARIDGAYQKHFNLDFTLEEEELNKYIPLQWSPDSKNILIGSRIMDVESGEIQKCSDPNTEDTIYGRFSPDGDQLYYLASVSQDPNTEKPLMDFKSVDLRSKRIQTVFKVSDIPKLNSDYDGRMFSIAPNCKVVLMRCVIKTENYDEKSALIFWDGKTRKIVETDRWLKTPFYTEANITFDKKLIGKWKGKNGEILESKKSAEKVYKVTIVEDDKKHQMAANLVKLKDTMFLAVFYNESVLKENNAHDRLVPDMFMRIDQIKPKLLLQEMEYDEVSELFNKDPNLLKQETIATDYDFEGIRIK